MNKTSIITLLALAGLTVADCAIADCGASATPATTRKAYENGQKLESAGNLAGAFGAYIAAQEVTCEDNPVEKPAAGRAAKLAETLGRAAEQKGDFDRAFYYYDEGGRYADADRVMMITVRAQPDSPAIYTKARHTFEYRDQPAFKSNNAVRLGFAGAYQPNPQNLAEVLAMPPKGVERAFQKEASAFNEQYLREYAQLIQSRPEDLTDFAAMDAFARAHTALVQKWGDDRLKASHDAFGLVQSWIGASSDPAWSAKVEAQRQQRLEQRAAILTKSYSGAPKLLDDALHYQLSTRRDHLDNQARAAVIKTQAGKLGDKALAQRRYGLAVDYYGVADQDAKAQAARDEQQRLAMNKMQPQIDEMKKQAEQMRQQFSDPEKIKAMQEQAQAIRKSMQQQQQTNAKSNARKADDLEKELGL